MLQEVQSFVVILGGTDHSIRPLLHSSVEEGDVSSALLSHYSALPGLYCDMYCIVPQLEVVFSDLASRVALLTTQHLPCMPTLSDEQNILNV